MRKLKNLLGAVAIEAKFCQKKFPGEEGIDVSDDSKSLFVVKRVLQVIVGNGSVLTKWLNGHMNGQNGKNCIPAWK